MRGNSARPDPELHACVDLNFRFFINAMPKKKVKTYTISVVAKLYEVHPQTLRMYEREGLIKPSRSDGNTRLFTDIDLERLEIILSLTRELGVNLAGVEIILNMRNKMDAMQQEFERFFEYLRTHANEISSQVRNFSDSEALIPISKANRPVDMPEEDED